MPFSSLLEAWNALSSSNSQSMLKQYLTAELFEMLKVVTTQGGATLLDVIQSGAKIPESKIGAYAADPDSYRVFARLFDPIISQYHGTVLNRQPPLEFGDPLTLRNVDPEGKYVLSTRIRCARSIAGFPFNPKMTKSDYLDIETGVRTAVESLSEGFNGTYYPLVGMRESDRQQLVDDHFLFKNDDRYLEAANATRFWPAGRGIFHNQDKTFLIWVNEEDHLRIISMEPGADLCAVYGRLVAALRELERLNTFRFVRDERLGFLTMCPNNIGNTIRASVHIKLPELGESMMMRIAEKHHLQVRGTKGEHSEGENGVFDISNKRRLGMNEYDAVKALQDGVIELITAEKDLVSRIKCAKSQTIGDVKGKSEVTGFT